MKTPEPTWYVGAPASGKTTAAIAHGIADAEARGVPLVVVDTIGAANCARLELARDVRHLVELVWINGQSARIQPEGKASWAVLWRAIRAGGHVAVVVDEASIAFGEGGPAELLALLRQYRHVGVGVGLTTQHLSGDVPQAARALAPRWCVFRTTSPRALDVIERDLGLDRSRVQNLPRWQYLEVRSGFDLDRAPAKGGDSRLNPGGADTNATARKQPKPKRNAEVRSPDRRRSRGQLPRGTVHPPAPG